jgi:hypothetical protein
MNMFQLQERIKDFSKDQLVKEMQQPSGAVPPFLVLSELQRRTRMEQAFNAEQAKQGQQTTVAQEAVAAAGVPQGGIADMARAMAPQTDMAGNTGATPVQGMYGGGQVKRMQPGGGVEGPNTARLRELRRLLALGSGVALPRMSATPIDPLQGPNVPMPPVDASEFGGLPDFMTAQGGTVPPPGPGIMPSDIGRALGESLGFGPAMNIARATRDTPEPLPMDTGTALAVPEEGAEALLPPPESLAPPVEPPAPPTEPVSSAAGGAGRRATGAADADKWLALAQFGLGLMASQAPTLGGAVGEAGTMALGQLRESQREAYERDLAERTLAARTAGGGDGGSSDRSGLSPSNLISVRADLVEQLGTLTDRLGGSPTAAAVADAAKLRDQISGLDRLLGLDAIGGLGSVSSDPAIYRLPSATQ